MPQLSNTDNYHVAYKSRDFEALTRPCRCYTLNLLLISLPYTAEESFQSSPRYRGEEKEGTNQEINPIYFNSSAIHHNILSTWYVTHLPSSTSLTPQGSPMEYNGGSVVAMVGKDCVAIASDMRLGQQSIGVAHNFEKVGSGIYTPFALLTLTGLSYQRQALHRSSWLRH